MRLKLLMHFLNKAFNDFSFVCQFVKIIRLADNLISDVEIGI